MNKSGTGKRKKKQKLKGGGGGGGGERAVTSEPIKQSQNRAYLLCKTSLNGRPVRQTYLTAGNTEETQQGSIQIQPRAPDKVNSQENERT